MNKNTINLYSLVGIGFLLFLLFTTVEDKQEIPQILKSSWDKEYFKEVWAGTEANENEEKDESAEDVEQKTCNKLFDSETCERMKKDQPTEIKEKEKEKKELTEDELKSEAIINKYLDPVGSEKPSIDNGLNSEIGLDNNIVSRNNNSIILSNQNESIDSVSSIQPSNNSSNILVNSQNIDTLNQFQLADFISSTISSANNIDKNKVIQSLTSFIEATKTGGGNVIDSLKKIAEIISKDPSGNVAKRIINAANQQ